MDCFYSSSSKCSFHKTLVPRHLSSYIFSTVFICNAVKDILKCKSAAQSHKNIHLLFGILFENIKPLKKKKRPLKLNVYIIIHRGTVSSLILLL